MRRKLVVLFFAVLALFCLRCSKDIAGTTTETQTGKSAAVVGLIVYSDSLPVNDADVILHDQNAVKKIVMPLGKQTALIRSGQTKTNINGFFRFDSVDTGKYYVEVNDHDTLGALLEAAVRDSDTLVQVNGVLKRMGTIEGAIDTSLVSKTVETYIYIVEVQKLVAVDSSGAFVVSDLPPYNYTIRVIHDTVVVQSPLDTAKITVHGNDTVHVGNLPPQVLLGVDTAAGVSPCTVKVIYKVTDPDQDTISAVLNYGDGKSDKLSQLSGAVSHIYDDTGAFKIILTADDGRGGIGKDSTTVAVHKNNPPVAQLIADTTSGIAPFSLKVVYKATDPDGDPLFVFLNYADGKIDTLMQSTGSIVHVYSDSGTYKMLLVANDDKGGVGRDSLIIKVKGPPPSTPSLLTPLDKATDLPVSLTLTWNKAVDASGYYVAVASDTLFSEIYILDSTLTLTDTSKVISGLSNSTTYFWRVRAKNAGGLSNWSSPRSFSTIIAAPQTPTLTSPANGSTEQSLTPTLTWSTVTGASNYHVQVSTVITFATILVEDSTLTSESKSLGGLANGTLYYWRVQAKNAGGVSAWSGLRGFTTIIAALQTPTLTSPANGSTGQSLTPTLTWSTVTGALSYHVQVSKSSTFAPVFIEDSTLTSTSKALSGLSNSTTCYWRAQAKNVNGVSGWTSPWSFTTENTETLTVFSTNDGGMQNIGDSRVYTYAQILNGTGGVIQDIGIVAAQYSNKVNDAVLYPYICGRSFFTFQVQLPAGSVVTGATVSIYGDHKNGGCTNKAYQLYNCGDYGTFAADSAHFVKYAGNVLQSNASYSYTTFAAPGWNDYPLTAGAVGALNKTGNTFFALRETNGDVNGTIPVFCGNYEYIALQYSADANPPKLVVVYTVN